jgi:hypothetical protein
MERRSPNHSSSKFESLGILHPQVYPSNQMKNHRTHELESWHHTESELATTIAKTILDDEAKEFLLRPALERLSEVKTSLLPNAVNATTPGDANRWYALVELELNAVKKELARAQEMLDKYGANIQFIGD